MAEELEPELLLPPEVLIPKLQERIQEGLTMYKIEVTNNNINELKVEYDKWNKSNLELLRSSFDDPNNKYKLIYKNSILTQFPGRSPGPKSFKMIVTHFHEDIISRVNALKNLLGTIDQLKSSVESQPITDISHAQVSYKTHSSYIPMATRSQTMTTPPTELIMSPEEYKIGLEERVHLGKKILDTPIRTHLDLDKVRKEYADWNHYNSEFLKSAFNNPNNEYKSNYDRVGIPSRVFYISGQNSDETGDFKRLFENKISYLNRLVDTSHLLKHSAAYQPIIDKPKKNTIDEKKIFIVHGHNHEVKLDVTRTLERLGLEPIILHEQPEQGRTVIEKFMDHSNDTGFAIILLTGDDVGHLKNLKTGQLRARQNVILEMGFFIGRLGRNKIFLLKEDGVEEPSDMLGVIYTPLDSAGGWKIKLAKELRGAGYEADANKL